MMTARPLNALPWQRDARRATTLAWALSIGLHTVLVVLMLTSIPEPREERPIDDRFVAIVASIDPAPVTTSPRAVVVAVASDLTSAATGAAGAPDTGPSAASGVDGSPEPPAPARVQPARPQPARPQPARPQPARPQPARPQPARPQPAEPPPAGAEETAAALREPEPQVAPSPASAATPNDVAAEGRPAPSQAEPATTSTDEPAASLPPSAEPVAAVSPAPDQAPGATATTQTSSNVPSPSAEPDPPPLERTVESAGVARTTADAASEAPTDVSAPTNVQPGPPSAGDAAAEAGDSMAAAGTELDAGGGNGSDGPEGRGGAGDAPDGPPGTPATLRATTDTRIPYPREAWSNRWEASCSATLHVDHRGRVTDLSELSCSSHEVVFGPAFRDYVLRRFRFEAARAEGERVASTVRWTHDFTLEGV